MANIDTLSTQADDVTKLDAILSDLTALRGAVVAITAKLDSDAGVTDTDYASSCDPAALTTTS